MDLGVAKHGLPNRIEISWSSSKLRTMKSIGIINLRTLTIIHIQVHLLDVPNIYQLIIV